MIPRQYASTGDPLDHDAVSRFVDTEPPKLERPKSHDREERTRDQQYQRLIDRDAQKPHDDQQGDQARHEHCHANNPRPQPGRSRL